MKWVYLFWTRLLTGPSPWMVFSCFEIILICLHTFIICIQWIDLGTDRHRHVFLDGHENSPIISNMLCVKKTTLKIGIRIVLDCRIRYVNYLYFSKTLEYHPSHHENPPIISNMLCVKKTTLKFGIRIVLDTRQNNFIAPINLQLLAICCV